MDYGVSLKEAHKNPSRKSAHYAKQSPFKGSNRQIRGAVLKELVTVGHLSVSALIKRISFDKDRIKSVIDRLHEEGLLIKRGSSVTLP